MIKLTLVLDPDEGEQLIGLVAKAFGRGELGIDAMRIERERAEPLRGGKEYAVGYADGEALRPVRQSTIAKMVAARELPKPKRPASPKVFAAARKRGDNAFPGMRAVVSGKPNVVSLTLKAMRLNLSRQGIREMVREAGFNPNGLSPVLTKLLKRGYAKNPGAGVWRLTPKGEELERMIHEKVEHDDRENS
jgi:predicted transcriptional regulator